MRDPFSYAQVFIDKPTSDGGFQSGVYVVLMPMTAPVANMLGYQTIYTQPPAQSG